MKLFIVASCCLLIFVSATSAISRPQDTTSAVQQSTLPALTDTRVPVPEASDKAMSYYNSGNVLWVVDIIFGILIPAIVLFSGLSAKIRSWAERMGRKWFFVIGIYFILFSILMFIINLPLSYYEEFVRQHAYDLSTQTFGKWFGDSLKSLMVGIIVGVLFLWIPYLLLARSLKRWWLYVGILAIPFLFLFIIVAPIWISPLFNDFGPMKDKALETQILALAERAGIGGSRVYEVNKSVDTKEVNAYVTGFLNTKRIVLWDTIIDKLNKKELMFVMGHEMGHYVLGHVWKSVLFFSVLIICTLYAVYRAANGLIARYKIRFGFDRLSDIASLPLIMLLASITMFVITPIASWYSRYNEHEADRFGLELTRDNHDAATTFVKLQQENLSNPRPGWLYILWRADHPVLGDRIDFANEYRPWETGGKMEYEEYFKK